MGATESAVLTVKPTVAPPAHGPVGVYDLDSPLSDRRRRHRGAAGDRLADFARRGRADRGLGADAALLANPAHDPGVNVTNAPQAR